MSHLDIAQILAEAKSRWLRPSEVCEIIRNFQKFHLTPDPPYKPSGGSLFLFDRKALRYFRKDGHRWRKKKDGKTVREAHEKLKSGSVDVLHCYYAHGEDNENFQRRSYWMLDGQLEHIVLVHYREVNEGSKQGFPHPLSSESGIQTHSWGAQTTVAAQSSYTSSPSTVAWNGQAPSSEFDDVDSGEDFNTSLTVSIPGSDFQISSIPANNAVDQSVSLCGPSTSHPYAEGSIDVASLSARYNPFFTSNVVSGNLLSSKGQETNYEASHEIDFCNSREHVDVSSCVRGSSHANSSHIYAGTSSDASDTKYGVERKFQVLPDTYFQRLAGEDGRLFEGVQKIETAGYSCHPDDKHTSNDVHHLYLAPKDQLIKNANEDSLETNADQLDRLKKLDSFGRWMNKEIGRDCDESLMATDSSNYWNALDTQNNDKEVSSLSRHMQLDIDSLGPSLSQEQLFSILDFSPDWAYSGSETKVLISGTFLGGVKSTSIKWCCMFGEIEVSAEVLTGNVLRCRAPTHTPGRVPFYITCSNRLACSEIREFEYREKYSGDLTLALKSGLKDEMHIQIQFAKMLALGVDRKKVSCSVEKCPKCSLKKELFPMLHDDKIEWDKIEKDSETLGYYGNPRDALIQKLLKSKLYEWLICKSHEDGKGPNVLDEEGQGVIHLAAALGYEWAMRPVIVAGVSPSFRDARGRTALHWAAYFGREETVATLVRLGTAPGAVEDPTRKFPEGRTAADLASSRGQKGIAGYLAEAYLQCQLSSLALKESVMDSVSATLAAEKAIETVENHSTVTLDGDKGEQLSLRGSLAAVRNSAQAAARIQAAFRVHSFRQRQLSESNDEDSAITSEEMLVSALNNKPQKIVHFNDSLHMAAVKIQQKYRGWKGRKEFLKIRNRIVKIQAYVRGHQVRKQYKKIIWSVGIVEKVILRWRRKGTGLRGFRAENASGGQVNTGKMDEYDFLRLGRKQVVAGVERALASVQSMVRYSEARGQYMRLVASSKNEGGCEDKTSDQVRISDEN
uniref:Calmodulin-binding transcription activator 1 n=1 Tax=Anthurium amnicola TaxID=1678845 RepID=A0A1D1Z014_9ARAE